MLEMQPSHQYNNSLTFIAQKTAEETPLVENIGLTNQPRKKASVTNVSRNPERQGPNSTRFLCQYFF
jgi:hypothetical protein